MGYFGMILFRVKTLACHAAVFALDILFGRIIRHLSALVSLESQQWLQRNRKNCVVSRAQFSPASDGFCGVVKTLLWRCPPNDASSQTACHEASFSADRGPLAYEEVGGTGQNICENLVGRPFGARWKHLPQIFRHFQRRQRVSSIPRQLFTSSEHKKVVCALLFLRKNDPKLKKCRFFDHKKFNTTMRATPTRNATAASLMTY